MINILKTLANYMIEEHEYFADPENRNLYPDILSMVQDSLQGELENTNEDEFDTNKRELLGYLNLHFKEF